MLYILAEISDGLVPRCLRVLSNTVEMGWVFSKLLVMHHHLYSCNRT